MENKKALNYEQIEEILLNMDIGCAEDNEVEFEGVLYCLREKENEGWMSEGKWEQNYYIYELVYREGSVLIPTGIFIGQEQSRSGSYYSDYYYEFEQFEVVEQVEKTITVKEWVVKKR